MAKNKQVLTAEKPKKAKPKPKKPPVPRLPKFFAFQPKKYFNRWDYHEERITSGRTAEEAVKAMRNGRNCSSINLDEVVVFEVIKKGKVEVTISMEEK